MPRRRTQSNRTMLRCSALEDRTAPAVFGIPWGDARHLAISLAPDATSISNSTSALASTMNAAFPGQDWQREIYRAAQTWASVTNVDLGVVVDSGLPFGASGDNREGIRIGAVPLAGGALAIATPPNPYFGDSWSGEIVYNSTNALNPAQASVYSVFLHEFGHALGMPPSDDPASAMFQQAGNPAPTLSAGDIAMIRSLYGMRQPDHFDAADPNNAINDASNIDYNDFTDPLSNQAGRVPMVWFGDVTTATDLDYYRFDIPADYSGPVTIRVRSRGHSLLAPKATLYQENGTLIATTTSTETGGGELVIQLNQAIADARYYVRIEGAVAGVFGIGRYAASIIYDARVDPSYLGRLDAVMNGPHDDLSDDDLRDLLTSNGPVNLNDDLFTDDAIATARPLTTAAQAYNYSGSIASAVDVDYYRVRTAPAAGTTLLTATVRVPEGTPLAKIELRDSLGVVVPANVLFHGDGRATVQADQLAGNTDYFVRVTATGQTNYDLVVIANGTAAAPHNLVQTTLGQLAVNHQLVVVKSQVFHFLFGVTGAAGQAARMSLTNGLGTVLYEVDSSAGQINNRRPLLLTPGNYVIRFSRLTPGFSPLTLKLQAAVLSDPIGPQAPDPSQTPAGPSASLTQYYLITLKRLAAMTAELVPGA